MRLGWDEGERNAAALARRAEAAGATMITVHARTRSQMYDGRADWAAVGEVVAAVARRSSSTATVAASTTRGRCSPVGREAVMVGRAAVGAPWLVGAIARALKSGAPLAEPPAEARAGRGARPHRLAARRPRPAAGLRHARKHLAAYAEKAGAPPSLRRALVTSEDADEALRLLVCVFAPRHEREAA